VCSTLPCRSCAGKRRVMGRRYFLPLPSDRPERKPRLTPTQLHAELAAGVPNRTVIAVTHAGSID
jgi:hypothetical protein